MTDKERLTNIIHNAQNKYLNLLKFESSILADYLIANGVIVPPCKVEDTVYMITPNGNIRNLTIESIDIELEKKEVKMTYLAVYEFEGKPCYMQIQSFKFGKTVFLTREEAEKALERSKGNA